MRCYRTGWILSQRLLFIVTVLVFIIGTVFFLAPNSSPQTEGHSQLAGSSKLEKKSSQLHKKIISSETKDSRCRVIPLDSFAPDLMPYITDFGDHKCKVWEGTESKAVFKKGALTVDGKDVNYIRTREVKPSSNAEKYDLGEFQFIVKPRHFGSELSKGTSGSIQHAVTKHCLGPKDISSKAVAEGTEVVFTSWKSCSNASLQFTFESNGLVKHKPSGLCMQPKGGSVNPPNDTPLTLGKSCQSHFQTAADGLLQHVESKKCIHPLGGGKHPSPGTRICVYDSCAQEDRLKYRWFVPPKETSGSIQHAVTKHCLGPKDISSKAVAEGMEVVFTSWKSCSDASLQFTFESNGLVKHKPSGLCMQPEGGSVNPPNDTPLTLGKSCQSHFQTVADGLLQHVESKKCIHPLGGAKHPSPGTRICVYDSCAQEDRLKYRWFAPPKDMDENISETKVIPHEMTLVETWFVNDKLNRDFLLQVQEKEDVKKRSYTGKSLARNVVMLVLEEVSAAHFERKLSQSFKYFTDNMKGTVFVKHGVMSLQSENNLWGILQGDSDKEKTLFSLFKEKGYATLFDNDKTTVLDDNKVLKLDADHNSLPFWKFAARYYDVGSRPYCIGSQALHDIHFEYINSFLRSYNNLPKFAVSFIARISDWNVNGLGYFDKPLLTFLQETIMKMKNTVLVITSMRGTREGRIGQTAQGQREAKLPFLGIFLSEDLRAPLGLRKLTNNVNKLTTPFDVYVTLRNVLDQSTTPKIGKGVSLSGELEPRDCNSAGLAKESCPCE